MTKRHPTPRRLWPVARQCIDIGAHAQPSQPGDAAQVGTAIARGIAGAVLAPATAPGAGQAGANQSGAAQGSGN